MLSTSKIQDLVNGVGKEFSDNFSKTCRAELVQVLTKGDDVKCIVRDVDAYGKTGGAVRVEAGWLTWNAMYF